MNERYAGGGEKSTRLGGCLLAAISLFAAVLVIAGLYYATGAHERNQVALAAAGCEPNLSPSGLQCVTVFMLNNQYRRLANPAIQQVNTDLSDYNTNERHNLAAAEAALKAEVTAENAFAHNLAQFPFPPSVVPRSKALIRAIHAQAKLTARQARSSSIPEMRSFNRRVKGASATVRTELGLVRMALLTPVTPKQEP